MRGYRARHELAALDQREGNAAAAEAGWREVLKERPEHLPAWLGLAELYLTQARWPELEALAGRLGVLPRGEAKAELLACRALLARGLPADGRVRAEALTGRRRDWLPGWVTLSHALLQEG